MDGVGLLTQIGAGTEIGFSVLYDGTLTAGKDDASVLIIDGEIEVGIVRVKIMKIVAFPLRAVVVWIFLTLCVVLIIGIRGVHRLRKGLAGVGKIRIDQLRAAVAVGVRFVEHNARQTGRAQPEYEHDQKKSGQQLEP